MLHKFRTVMGTIDHERLSGHIEMDETYVGGKRKAATKGHFATEKSSVAGAIEPTDRSLGRARPQVIPGTSSASLAGFIQTQIKPGSTSSLTAGWPTMRPLLPAQVFGTKLPNVSASASLAHVSLPAAHLLFSLLKRVLDGTYQGSLQTDHLQCYLDEFVFRFNRRNSRDRGLLLF